MDEIKQANITNIPQKYKAEHAEYQFTKRVFLPRNEASQCTVSVYEIPPQKAAYPYHYHAKNEEVFYIISGTGLLRTPQGEKAVSAGDLLFFPANRSGAHKLTNTSETEKLVYIDFDTANDIDVAFYPDSGKMGVWGMDVNKVYKIDADVDYYRDE